MKLVIDISEEKYEWIKKNNPNADTNSIVGAVANGTPYEEQPKAKWEEIWDGHGHSSYFCSRCGTQEGKTYAFCPNCKADMRSVDEGLRERAMSDLSKVVDDAYKKARGDV